MTDLEILNKKNAEIFNITIKHQNELINSMQIEINGLKNTISMLDNRINYINTYISEQRIKQMGNGPSSI